MGSVIGKSAFLVFNRLEHRLLLHTPSGAGGRKWRRNALESLKTRP
jgi:hypothetical protein